MPRMGGRYSPPPYLPHRSSSLLPLYYHFVLNAFSMSSGSVGRREPGSWEEAFPRETALGVLKTGWIERLTGSREEGLSV